MSDTFLSDLDLAKRYSVSRNTVWRWAREREDFPQPVRLSPGCTRWRLFDLQTWESQKVAEVL